MFRKIIVNGLKYSCLESADGDTEQVPPFTYANVILVKIHIRNPCSNTVAQNHTKTYSNPFSDVRDKMWNTMAIYTRERLKLEYLTR